MIGVFDSGIGGLIVARAITKAFPREPLIYLGDMARLPYGNKSKEAIIEYSTQGVDFLVKNGADIIVIGCNTSSAVALPSLQKQFSVPVVGVIDPAVEEACASTKTKRVGVIGTRATIGSHIYEKKLKKCEKGVQVFETATPLLAPLIEEGWIGAPETKSVLEKYLKGFKAQKIDTLILGCTHYPALERQIAQVAGTGVRLISSATAVIAPLKKMIKADTMAARAHKKVASRLFVTDRTPFAVSIAKKWLGKGAHLELTHL